MKDKFRKVFNRIFLTALLIVLQIIWWGLLLFKLTEYSTIISVVFSILSLIMVVYLVSKDDNPEFRIGWIIVILIFPLFGGLFYFSFGDKKPSKRMRRKLNLEHDELKGFMPQDKITIDKLEEINVG